jgi:hypothetical protein
MLHLFKIRFNIILPSTPRSSKWSNMEHDYSCDSPYISILISLGCTRPKREVIHSAAGQLADAQLSVLNDVQGTETPFLRIQPKCLKKSQQKRSFFSKNRCQKRLWQWPP